MIKVNAEVAFATKATKTSELKCTEAVSKVDALLKENKKLKDEVHLCKDEVNAFTKRVENSDNLQKIVSSALEVANKENGELKARVDELSVDVSCFDEGLKKAREATVYHYVAHFYETTEYDGLEIHWRRVSYNEVFERFG